MYAVIKTGGKQYKVSEGDVIEVERLKATEGQTSFTPLLVVTDEGKTVLGAKQLSEFPVAATVVGDAKGEKISVFKYRPKSGYASKTGHRQKYSMLEINSIGEIKARPKPADQPA